LLDQDPARLAELQVEQQARLREWHEPARVLARLLEVL
jgi:hypothetical protein